LEQVIWFFLSRIAHADEEFGIHATTCLQVAMTVHKSQSSELSHTALELPDVLNPVLTK
jgi:hypothetical protein